MHDLQSEKKEMRPGILSASLIFLTMGIVWTIVLFARILWMGREHEISYSIGAALGLSVGFSALYLWASKAEIKSTVGKFSLALAIFCTLALTIAFQIIASGVANL